MTVSYAELDLSKTAGVSELYARLQRAAGKVCGMQTRSADSLTARLSNSEKEQCYDDALDSAVASLEVPGLYEMHSG